MAPVEQFTIYVGALVIVAVIFVIVTLVNKFSSKGKPKAEGDVAVRAMPRGEAVQGDGPRRRVRRNRMRQVREESDEEMMPEDDEAEELYQGDEKVGAKKLKKLQEKAEKRAHREAEADERVDRKKRQELADEERRKDDERDKKEEKAREEEEQRLKEERERQEHEEYLKMKEMFSVDDEGEDEVAPDLNSESLLQEFITYIKEMKVVMLEDLAGHFKLKTQDVIQRVQDLNESGELTGVIDDRGKFIYITMEELKSVAKYVRQHGRVSISELAESSNRLINLNPENSETHKRLVSDVSG